MCLLGGSLGEQRNFLGWGIAETDVFISRWNWRFLRDSMRLIYLTFRRSWTSSNRKLKLNYNFCFLFSVGKSKANFIRISEFVLLEKLFHFDTPRIGYSHIPTYFWYIWTRRETAYCALTIVNPGSLINQESLEIPFSLGCSRRYYYAYEGKRWWFVKRTSNKIPQFRIDGPLKSTVNGWLRELTVRVINLKFFSSRWIFQLLFVSLYITLHPKSFFALKSLSTVINLF